MKKLFTLMLAAALLFAFAVPAFGEDKPAEKPAEKPKIEETKKESEYDWEIGKKFDGETITKILTDLAEALKQKGSFWRNPNLWEAVWLIILIILGLLAAKYGWKKKKWGKILQSVEKSVNTTYIEFIRETKLKSADGKLTKDEMKKALEDAWEMTKADLLAQNIDLVKWIAKEYFPVIVDKILKAVKKK